MTNASFANLAVLVVDDNKDMRGLLEGIVREFGVRSIESARDGASALSAMVAKPVGLVLCDIQMRPMDGLEFVKTVRRGHLGIERSVPIILLTAHSEIYRVKEAGMVGADEFVTKPVSAATLHDRMLSVITKPLSSLVAARQENAARIDGSDHTAAAGSHAGDGGHGGDDGHAAAERA
ncbi:MAG: response regulator [Proteobacteria bacterium]|nr:response regulator [Pseudomonadota bacterium]